MFQGFGDTTDEGAGSEAFEGISSGVDLGGTRGKVHRVEVCKDGGRAGGTLGRRLREQPEHEGLQRRRAVRAMPGGGHGCGVEMLADDSDGVVADEGWPARDHFVEHASDGIEVGPGTDVAAHGLLRGHVSDGSHHGAGLSQPGAIESDREAEVADFRHRPARVQRRVRRGRGGLVWGGQPDVSRLQVAVDEAVAVGEVEAGTHLSGDAEGVLYWKAVAFSFFEQAFDVSAGHELGDEIGLAVVGANVVDGDDVRVGTELAHGLGLALDALAAVVVQAFGLDEGERDVAV